MLSFLGERFQPPKVQPDEEVESSLLKFLASPNTGSMLHLDMHWFHRNILNKPLYTFIHIYCPSFFFQFICTGRKLVIKFLWLFRRYSILLGGAALQLQHWLQWPSECCDSRRVVQRKQGDDGGKLQGAALYKAWRLYRLTSLRYRTGASYFWCITSSSWARYSLEGKKYLFMTVSCIHVYTVCHLAQGIVHVFNIFAFQGARAKRSTILPASFKLFAV